MSNINYFIVFSLTCFSSIMTANAFLCTNTRLVNPTMVLHFETIQNFLRCRMKSVASRSIYSEVHVCKKKTTDFVLLYRFRNSFLMVYSVFLSSVFLHLLGCFLLTATVRLALCGCQSSTFSTNTTYQTWRSLRYAPGISCTTIRLTTPSSRMLVSRSLFRTNSEIRGWKESKPFLILFSNQSIDLQQNELNFPKKY